MTRPVRSTRALVAIAIAAAVALLTSCNQGDDATPPAALPAVSGTLYAFGGTGSPLQDGFEPKGSLTAVAVNGSTVLFGRTAIGGANGCGIVFSVNPDGTNYQVLYRFGGADGCDPRHDAMTLNPSDGNLYATTQGVNQTGNQSYGNQGQIFSFKPGIGIPTPIHAVHTFAGAPDGGQQHSSFSIDPATGVLYGQSAQGGANNDGLLYAVKPDGTAFTPLFSFAKGQGGDPHGRIMLVQGVLYGIARNGGAGGFGSVYAYALDPAPGTAPFTVLHALAGGAGDGATSDHGYLTPVTSGGKTLFYGMTQCGGGGAGKDACGASDGGGDGIVFQIDPTAPPGSSAAFSIVHSFQGTEKGDGAAPYGSLLYDGGYLYGTTSVGGTFDKGTVFRFAPVAFGGTATPQILYHFGTQANDGSKPIDNVIRIGNALFGMTVYGGASGASPDDPKVTGNGTIFTVPLPD